MTKKQQKQYDYYRERLGVTEKGEDFVLKHILARDWNRDILLQDITQIKLSNGLISVKCSTRGHSYWFSVSDIGKEDGWREGMSQRDKELYVSGDLYRKLYE